ncbi:MAG: hypothetical protein QNJ54_06690 [Prochloraceae cyanobacterium]|nr:hypothetical protein [Prochloraceae cyanobacterium]
MAGVKESSGKKIRVSLYIEEETKKKAVELAEKESRSLNNYIQHLLEREIAKNENATNQEFSVA